MSNSLPKKERRARAIAGRFQNIAKYFESILQDSTDIIFTLDTEGYILKFNKGAEMHFGYTQEEIVGKPLTHLFVNESDKQKVLDGVLLTGKTVNEEIPLKTKSGGIILVNLSMSEMKNDKNQIIGLVVTAKDITERKTAGDGAPEKERAPQQAGRYRQPDRALQLALFL